MFVWLVLWVYIDNWMLFRSAHCNAFCHTSSIHDHDYSSLYSSYWGSLWGAWPFVPTQMELKSLMKEFALPLINFKGTFAPKCTQMPQFTKIMPWFAIIYRSGLVLPLVQASTLTGVFRDHLVHFLMCTHITHNQLPQSTNLHWWCLSSTNRHFTICAHIQMSTCCNLHCMCSGGCIFVVII